MSQETSDLVAPDEQDEKQDEKGQEPAVVDEPHEQSLAARMERQRHALAGSEIFDVPGWRGLLAVELRYTGYRANRVIGRRHERVRDPNQQELRASADQIIGATVGLYEVKGDERVLQEGESWLSLARKVLGSDLAADTRERGALFALLAASREGSTGDLELMALYGEWFDWMTSLEGPVTEDLTRDFQRIQS